MRICSHSDFWLSYSRLQYLGLQDWLVPMLSKEHKPSMMAEKSEVFSPSSHLRNIFLEKEKEVLDNTG